MAGYLYCRDCQALTSGDCGKHIVSVAQQPYRCPVCEGRGTVPMNFYSGATIANSTAPEECRTCNGTGVLWR
jgi:DnaJ-class molecular chaperone